jgi:hypothetical protein
MKIKKIRLLFALLMLLIFSSRATMHFFYLALMWISLEILNSQKSYVHGRLWNLFNHIFVFFTIAVIVNRSRNAHFGNATEAAINIGEHFFYALVIGLKLVIYLRIMHFEIAKKQLLWLVISLNIGGFFNEVFQNVVCGRATLTFIADAQKDMLVNFIGSLVFLVCALLYLKWNTNEAQMGMKL